MERPKWLDYMRQGSRWVAGSSLVLFLGIHLVKGDEPVGGAVDPVLIGVAVVAVLFWLATSQPVADLFAPRPKLVAEVAENVPMEGFEITVEGRQEIGAYHLVSILVHNERDGGPSTATAEDVAAKVEAFDESGKRVSRSEGRWRTPIGEGLAPETVTFRPDHRQRPLDLAFKDVSGFALSSDCHLAVRKLHLAPYGKPGMPPGRYRLEVSLRGRNLRGATRLHYDLWNPPEKGGRLELLPPGADPSPPSPEATPATASSADRKLRPSEGVRRLPPISPATPVRAQQMSLKNAVRAEREEGAQLLVALRDKYHGVATYGRAIGDSDIRSWEANVRHLFRDDRERLDLFDHDPPRPPRKLGDLLVSALTGEHLARRMERRIAQLDKVIEGL